MRSFRVYVVLCVAVLLTVVGLPVLLWDMFLAERIPRVECQVYGRTAEQLRLPEGASISRDSGNCLDNACAVETRTITRVVLSDSETRKGSEDDC